MMMNAAAMRKITEKARINLGTETVDHWIEEVAFPEIKERAELGFSNCQVSEFPSFQNAEISKQLCRYAGDIFHENGYSYSTDREGTVITAVYW